MRTIMVRYKTSEATADTNASLVAAVFAELAAKAPGGIRYATYRLPDGVFMHIATVESPDQNPLNTLAAFKEFQRQLGERCLEKPTFTDVTIVGSYDGLK